MVLKPRFSETFGVHSSLGRFTVFAPSEFYELVSGRRRGVLAALARGALRLAEIPYTWAVRWRNRRYQTGKAAVARVDVPVISVGNLTLGGTGKSPMVEWLAQWFLRQNLRTVIVSRGYGSSGAGPNDEALELELKLPGVPHLQNPDRARAARQAIEEFRAQVIILDDGFQHRRLARDLDLVLVDALEPFGCEHVFPRGTLREPLDGFARADAIVLSRGELIELSEREAIRERLLRFTPGAAWVEVRHAPRRLYSTEQNQQEVRALSGRPVAAFCGIGNPRAFRESLAGLDYRVMGFREFPDHHSYTSDDLQSLDAWLEQLQVDAAVCTLKDLVKIGGGWTSPVALWALQIEMQIVAGQDRLEKLLTPLAERARQAGNAG